MEVPPSYRKRCGSGAGMQLLTAAQLSSSRDCTMVADGFDPDGSTFSFLIEGLGRAGRIGDAVEIFEKMEKETGCAPDTVVYNAMISNFISVGDLDECMMIYGPPHAALMIYKKARAVGCRISLSAYKLLLMRLSTFGKSGMLLNIWDEMQGSGYSSDVEVYEHVINGLCNNGQLENAILLMEECMSKGFCPSRLTCSKLYNKLLTSNKVERAYKLFLKIKAARLADNARKYWRAKGWHF